MSDITVPDVPHMPPSAVEWLKAKLPSCRAYLEFGSGGSTLLAARSGVPRIVTVESDREYAEAVRKAAAGIPNSRVEVIYVDIGPTKEWGRPLDSSRRGNWPEYPNAGWNAFDGEVSPDLVLIDGRFRTACLLLSLLRSKPGTNLLFDDYTNREAYKVVERFLTPSQFFGRTALFETPETVDQIAVQEDLSAAYLRPA